MLHQSPPDNYTGPTDDDLAPCGINDCPSNNITNVNLEKPPSHIVGVVNNITNANLEKPPSYIIVFVNHITNVTNLEKPPNYIVGFVNNTHLMQPLYWQFCISIHLPIWICLCSGH